MFIRAPAVRCISHYARVSPSNLTDAAQWVADMDFRSPQPIVDALVARAKHAVYGYTDCPPQLAQSLVARLVNVYGCTAVEPSEDWFRWTPGLLPMLNHAVRAACRNKDTTESVAIPTPIYPPFLDAPGNCGASLTKVPLLETRLPSVDGGGANTLRYDIDWDALEAALRDPSVKLLHWCNPHNPAVRTQRGLPRTLSAPPPRLPQACLLHARRAAAGAAVSSHASRGCA